LYQKRRESVHRRAPVRIAGLSRDNAELVMTVGVVAEEFDLVGDGAGTMKVRGLQSSNKNDGAILKMVLEGKMLDGELVNGEFRFLDEEEFFFIPAGDFDGGGSERKRFSQAHVDLRGEKSSLSAKKENGNGCR
jgi:hypothetical protein